MNINLTPSSRANLGAGVSGRVSARQLDEDSVSNFLLAGRGKGLECPRAFQTAPGHFNAKVIGQVEALAQAVLLQSVRQLLYPGPHHFVVL